MSLCFNQIMPNRLFWGIAETRLLQRSIYANIKCQQQMPCCFIIQSIHKGARRSLLPFRKALSTFVPLFYFRLMLMLVCWLDGCFWFLSALKLLIKTCLCFLNTSKCVRNWTHISGPKAVIVAGLIKPGWAHYMCYYYVRRKPLFVSLYGVENC